MLNIKDKVRFGQSKLVDAPCMMGYFKPVILLPFTLSTYLSAEEIEIIILHELAHIKRNDYLVNMGVAPDQAFSVMGNPWFDLLCCVIILSAAQTLMFSINASTGGLDILAKIVNKYLHFDMGKSVSVAGAIICLTAFAINPFQMVIIGLIATWINGMVVNMFTANLNQRKRVCIVSKDYDRIRRYIIDELHRGCTLYEVIGGYTNEKSIELESLLTNDEFSKLMEYLGKNEINAFTTAGNVSEVYGLWSKDRHRARKHAEKR
jgi:uncharacterized membrane-anchored protein YitT (DUF2179 family)